MSKYIILPSGVSFDGLDAANDAARLDSTTGPEFAATVVDDETGEVLEEFQHGKRV